MLDNPARSLETVRRIVEQIAKGLRAFHRMEMLHQDLRPENVMIDADGTVRIIDFGSVRVAGVAEGAPDFVADDILGTVQYAAPEYFLGQRGTERSDLFSLGVIAYELITGRLPYGARVSRARTARAQARLRYLPAAGPARAVPGWVDAALRRAVHVDPRKRYAALTELTTDLREPNPAYTRAFVPLAERDPVRFWQLVSLGLGLLAVLALLMR
jgi:serine/threonine protein kinase